MARSPMGSGQIGHGTDMDEHRAWGGGAEPTGEPRSQDNAGGRGVGLGLTTILGILLIAVPVIWAITYIVRAGTAGLGGGFTTLFGIVFVAAIAVGVLLLRGFVRA